MQNLKKCGVMSIAVFVVGAVTALAAERVGPVGVDSRQGTPKVAGTPGLTAGSGGTGGSAQCFSWKVGNQNQSGITWVSVNDAFLYTGAGLQFNAVKHAPADLKPNSELAGIIGVGFANPAFIPSSVDITFSFLPVTGSSSSSGSPGSPAPTLIGLTWFNEFAPGNTFSPSEQTVTTYPAFGKLHYTGFVPALNNNTRYLVYLKTGGKGDDGHDRSSSAVTADDDDNGNSRGFAAAGAICFNP